MDALAANRVVELERATSAASIETAAQQAPDKGKRNAQPVHTHVPALDGLRFLAALNVMVAHGYWYLVLLQREPEVSSAFANLMRTGANIGMTLFFVLSGFVIHFNYHKSVPASAAGKLDFFIARFARLYPLFLLVFGYDFFTLLWAQGYFSGYVFTLYDPFRALPQYLTFTETWWWWPIGSTSAYEYYGTWLTGATGVMWSLSTEAFFYFAYLFCAGALNRLSGRRLVIAGLAVSGCGLAFYIFGWTHSDGLKSWAAAHFPQSSPDEFVHWLLFQSPWGRISEFLLGAIAAQAFLMRAANGERLLTGRLVTYGSSAAFAFLILAVYGRSYTPYAAIGTQCGAAFIAILIYATARYRSYLASFLSNPLLIKLGNASYSLYLLHYFVLHEYGQWLVVRFPQVSRWAIFLAMMIVAIAISYVSYLVIERPAIRWVRRNFRPLRMEIWLPVTLVLVTAFSFLVSIHMRALAHSDPAVEGQGRISIQSASFGENCNAKLHDNIIGLMRRVCNGLTACAFQYDIQKIRDPAGGCDKNFRVLYSCGSGDGQLRYLIPDFNRSQMRIAFGCR
jgi:peptidoglycan/LPS O-acetylase OafA/YrhL